MPKKSAIKAKKTVKKVKAAPAKAAMPGKAASTKAAPVIKASAVPAETYFYANGKRKTSVACVRLHKNGKGILTINGRTFENYFSVFTDQDKILAPLRVTNNLKNFNISVKVNGGGVHSQAEAVRHGISKALLEFNPEYRSILKPLGFLTRDSRVKERKKYGLKRARRAPQWQKR